MQKIAALLEAKYQGDPRLKATVEQVRQIYRNNFFPEMKSNWRVYPNNIGHKDWPGCFRCHDGEHRTEDKKQMIKANDCNGCHVILAQGSGQELQNLNAGGQSFKHPGGEIGDLKCNECHTGANQ